ncbi:MAG: 3'(2'),5'-bisphosphate nucleotidase CysQ family protein, partial [Planctomycetota bacterium]
MGSLREAAETARELVREGAEVARAMQGKVTARDKGGSEGPVTEADLAVERVLLEGLRARAPGEMVLSEESPPPAPIDTRRLWCVDPVDGTREYLQGLPEYAVMIGLLRDGRPAAGAMALPGCGQVFWGWEGGGAFVEEGGRERRIELAAPGDAASTVAIHTRTHEPSRVRAELAKRGITRMIEAGGVGYKVAQLLLGRAHLYLHPRGGTAWWDSVGPAAILLAAGGAVATASGAPLVYRPDDGLLH